MNKILSIILLSSLLAVSCHKEQQLAIPEIQNLPEINTIGNTVFYTADDEPLTFLSSRDFKAWTDIIGLQARLDACLVPENVLDKMTTEALVASAMNYPLNYIIFAYDDPQTAVELIFENSTLHQELAARADAPAELTRLFAGSISDFETKTVISDEVKQLSYEDEMFLEYLISSDKISGRLNEEHKTILRNAVDLKVQERLSAPDKYSMASIEPLKAIDKAEKLSLINIETKGGEEIGYPIVMTPYGQTICAVIRNEHTDTELTRQTNLYLAQHPNAILRGPATARYNSHSYAWHMNSTDNTLWIKSRVNSETLEIQIEKYWTEDGYVEYPENSAERAFYQNADHSAIILYNGKYLSKWLEGPLMEHDKDDCPYPTTGIKYFHTRTGCTYENLTISGVSPIDLNEEVIYTVNVDQEIQGRAQIEWEVRFMDAPEPKPFTLTEVPGRNGTQYKLTCEEPGLYKIYVYGVIRGHRIYCDTHDVVAYPH